MVICSDTPSNMLKMKNMAMSRYLNSLNALRPSASASDFFSPLLSTGQLGSVRQYAARMMLNIPEV